jgi:hypothetical protein
MFAAILLMPLVVAAQDITASALKAAFVYKIVTFTDWPVLSPAGDPFVLCVMGDAAVGDALEDLVEGHEFAGRPLAVLAVGARPTAACRVLYVSGATAGEAAKAIAGLQDSPVLTISDIAGFTDRGGMAQFHFEGVHLRFTIKREAVKRSGLKMRGTLLMLGER